MSNGRLLSPRPWRVNKEYVVKQLRTDDGRWAEDPCPILDANGMEVITPSEYINVSMEDIELIVKAVNAFKEPQ